MFGSTFPNDLSDMFVAMNLQRPAPGGGALRARWFSECCGFETIFLLPGLVSPAASSRATKQVQWYVKINLPREATGKLPKI